MAGRFERNMGAAPGESKAVQGGAANGRMARFHVTPLQNQANRPMDGGAPAQRGFHAQEEPEGPQPVERHPR
jgi:hypothetical protein